MPKLSSPADIDSRGYFQRENISANRIVIKVHFLQIPNSISYINLGKFRDKMLRNSVGKKDMIFFEMYLLDTLPQENDVLFSRSNEEDTFEVH